MGKIDRERERGREGGERHTDRQAQGREGGEEELGAREREIGRREVPQRQG